jgi:hypothetical protein
MKRNRMFLIAGVCALLFVAMMSVAVVLAAEVRITGIVTEEGIVADDGQMYAVADNYKGKELLELVNKKVEITGTVEEGESEKVITVTGYVVIE